MKEKNDKGNFNISKNNNSCYIFSIITIFNFISILFTIIFLINCIYSPYSFHGDNIDEYSNDYCKNKQNDYYEFLCTNKYYKYNIKKSKFIWIITDGTSSDEMTMLGDYDKYKISSPFLVEANDITYRHTNEMHTAMITGRHNRNIEGIQITNDNILQQLVDAGYKINYRGWSLPIPDIVGEKKNGIKENKIFNKKFIENAHERTAFSSFCNITNPFPFINNFNTSIFQNPIPNKVVNDDLLKKIKNIVNSKNKYLFDKKSKIELYKELDELFKENPIDLFSLNIDDCLEKSFGWNEKENISILFYTTEVDDFHHCYGKTYINTVLQMYITEKMIEHLMKWIDNHDDYALIVTSDHGGQSFFGEDALRNHGDDLPGNEAILLLYTKELKEHYNEFKLPERYIHIIDASEIIAQILMNINIPINSEGFPKKLFNCDINAFIALKMKEIQLIQLIEKFIQKYNKYESSLKNLLNELKSNFSQINIIIKRYFSEDLEIIPNKKKEFHDLIEIYEKSLFNKQKQINQIISKNNKSIKNIALFLVIFIFIFIKYSFEMYFLFYELLDKEKAQLFDKKNKCWYIINLICFILFQNFWFYCTKLGKHLRESIIIYCFSYGYLITFIFFIYIFNCMIIYWKKNKSSVIILLGSIFCFTVFCQNISYSECIFYLRRNFTYFSKKDKIIINFFGFYLFLLFLIIKKNRDYLEKRYFIFFCKRKFRLNIISIIYFFFGITLFLEECTKLNYYEQTVSNRIFVCFNFIFFILLMILSHLTVYQENNEEIITVSINNNIINKEVKNKENDDTDSTDHFMGKKNKNSESNIWRDINEEKNSFVEKYRVVELPCIKIFLLLSFAWISSEEQKLFGLIILFPFLEVLDYLSNFFNSKIKDIIYNKQNNDSDETKLEETSTFQSINETKNLTNKTNKINSNLYYIFYFFLYIILQDMFLVANQFSFAIIKHSFGMENDKRIKLKFKYVLSIPKHIFAFIEKYRVGFIFIGFFLEKGIYDKYNKNEYSNNFLIRKIMLGIRIDFDIIYLFYQMLININDNIFIDLYTYIFVNILLLLFDYIGYILIKLVKIFQ